MRAIQIFDLVQALRRQLEGVGGERAARTAESKWPNNAHARNVKLQSLRWRPSTDTDVGMNVARGLKKSRMIQGMNVVIPSLWLSGDATSTAESRGVRLTRCCSLLTDSGNTNKTRQKLMKDPSAATQKTEMTDWPEGCPGIGRPAINAIGWRISHAPTTGPSCAVI